MKIVWKLLNPIDVTISIKNMVFLIILTVVSSITGALAWTVMGRIILSGAFWLICFVGYPAVFLGFFGGILYLYNHEFT